MRGRHSQEAWPPTPARTYPVVAAQGLRTTMRPKSSLTNSCLSLVKKQFNTSLMFIYNPWTSFFLLALTCSQWPDRVSNVETRPPRTCPTSQNTVLSLTKARQSFFCESAQEWTWLHIPRRRSTVPPAFRCGSPAGRVLASPAALAELAAPAAAEDGAPAARCRRGTWTAS